MATTAWPPGRLHRQTHRRQRQRRWRRELERQTSRLARPCELVDQYRIGLGFSLSAILMFFIGLAVAFIVTKSNYHFDPHFQYINSWRLHTGSYIVWFGTAVLLLSSVAAEFARRSMFRENDAMDEWIDWAGPFPAAPLFGFPQLSRSA